MRSRGIAELLLAGLCLSCSSFLADADPPTSNVTLAWDDSVGAEIAGYRIYHGVSSRNYTNIIDVGNVTMATVSNLVVGSTYYFAATAYDMVGLESDFSAEVQYTVVARKPQLRLALDSDHRPLLGATGPAGYSYNVLVSSDMTTWSAIASITIGTNGFAQYTDPATTTSPRRFYRLEQTSP